MTNVTVTQDHLELLARMQFDWDDECEWGAVSSDPKRPFGNSGVERDVSEILGREVDYGEARRLTIELAAIVQRAVYAAVLNPVDAGIGTGSEMSLPRRARNLLAAS
ncbi:MAG: hypothetical protein WBA97_34420 [Actinophytocola sp.]|uniref:hypothetical protein n=1 Tax=Actinophytocola sp. TaxID=1872138 RepID=UPI003C73CC42